MSLKQKHERWLYFSGWMLLYFGIVFAVGVWLNYDRQQSANVMGGLFLMWLVLGIPVARKQTAKRFS